VISALTPSRGRPEMLRRSVLSLREMAAVPAEILITADDDDPETITATSGLNAHVLVGPRKGYARLHEYYGELARASKGDWLLVWSDDAVMTTAGWDTFIEALPEHVLVADLRSPHSPGLCCFPAVRRRAMDALGGFFSTANPHIDTFWQDVGRATGTIAAVGAYVHHDRPDLTGRAPDETYREVQAGYRTADYYGPEHQAQLAMAIAIISDHSRGWRTVP
jgi:hypothetical protein